MSRQSLVDGIRITAASVSMFTIFLGTAMIAYAQDHHRIDVGVAGVLGWVLGVTLWTYCVWGNWRVPND